MSGCAEFEITNAVPGCELTYLHPRNEPIRRRSVAPTFYDIHMHAMDLNEYLHAFRDTDKLTDEQKMKICSTNPERFLFANG